MEHVLSEIAEKRMTRIRREGHALGVALPSGGREAPLVPFGREPFVVCEIKRRSPSRGSIAESLDPVTQAGRYVDAGVRSISVLTEEDHFGGSLADLIRVKQAFPDVSVLRKDFLLDEEDIEVSWRAGADAVLLIAALLPPERLSVLHQRALSHGMSALVEVHTIAEIDAIRSTAPQLVGVNSRDLSTFRVDRLLPVRLRSSIDWSCRTVFESGIFGRGDVSLATGAGYDGVLVGEAVVRRPEAISEIMAARRKPDNSGRFWAQLYSSHPESRDVPFVKICGLTNVQDVEEADRLGADLLGFVFADSPRRADPSFVRTLGRTRAQKVGVVVLDRSASNLDPRVRELLEGGYLDALQLHGDEAPEACRNLEFAHYKALRIKDGPDASHMGDYRSPRVLVDAFAADARGGTGKRLSEEALGAAAALGPLWVAGGLAPDNVGEIIRRYRPELVDVSSRIEASVGHKDFVLMRKFFDEVRASRVVSPGT